MNAFAQRLANWLANEVLVKQLARSKTFQSFALRTHLNVEKAKGAIKNTAEEVVLGGGEKGVKVGLSGCVCGSGGGCGVV